MRCESRVIENQQGRRGTQFSKMYPLPAQNLRKLRCGHQISAAADLLFIRSNISKYP